MTVGLVLAITPFAGAEPSAQPVPSAAELAASVSDLSLGVSDLELFITELDTKTTDGDETVISLTSDVLFDFNKADLPPNAPDRIAELLTDVPEGAAVFVGGHTDSMGDDSVNDPLSLARAEAVADVIAAARPDLDLTVEGFGSREPVADNTVGGEDNPQGRALNRRVEIRYAD